MWQPVRHDVWRAHLILNKEIAKNCFLGLDPFYEYDARRMIKKSLPFYVNPLSITETTKPPPLYSMLSRVMHCASSKSM